MVRIVSTAEHSNLGLSPTALHGAASVPQPGTIAGLGVSNKQEEYMNNEILKVIRLDNGQIRVEIVVTYDEPGMWGIILVDILKHLGNAYEEAGGDKAEAEARILELFEAEMLNPTDEPKRVK